MPFSMPDRSPELTRLIARLSAALGVRAEVDAPLGPLTTYRVGGRAAVLVHVDDDVTAACLAESLAEFLADAAGPVPMLVVGKGSNLLVTDAGFAGVVVQLGGEFGASTVDGHEVGAGGAAAMPVVARLTARAGLTGFEWAVGVPGSIGGGVRMNAGGHGSDIAASLVGVRVLDLHTGEDGVVPASALALAYRSSNLPSHHVVLRARIELTPGDPVASELTIVEIVKWRREHQPGGQNAGSVFTNPDERSAGWLIDRAGMKGFRIGSAEVSDKHANFIQADVGGRADDIFSVMTAIQHRVFETSGVWLHPETRLVGFPSVVPPDAAFPAAHGPASDERNADLGSGSM